MLRRTTYQETQVSHDPPANFDSQVIYECRQLGSFPRRRFLVRSAALVAAALNLPAATGAPRINPPALLENAAGGYRVLPAGQVFCGGVIPNEGREIVHVLLSPWVPL